MKLYNLELTCHVLNKSNQTLLIQQGYFTVNATLAIFEVQFRFLKADLPSLIQWNLGHRLETIFFRKELDAHIIILIIHLLHQLIKFNFIFGFDISLAYHWEKFIYF